MQVLRDPDIYVSSQASGGMAVFSLSGSDQQPSEDLLSIPITFTLIPKADDTYTSSNALAYTATIPMLNGLLPARKDCIQQV